MNLIESTRPTTVSASGADAGRTLRGASRNNRGLRVVISQAQQRGKDGAITGSFVILEPGDNKHAQSLAALVHRPTDAGEVLAVIRRRHAGCVHVVNTNNLALEPESTLGGPGTFRETPAAGRPAGRREGTVSDPDRFLEQPPAPSTPPRNRPAGTVSDPDFLGGENGAGRARSPFSGRTMPNQPKVFAFDVDPASLDSLRRAFPGWEVEATSGATTCSLDRDWDPGAAALLVVGARGGAAEVLGLCRGLRGQAGRAHTPLLVLVRPTQEGLVRAALDAGADSCLVVPVHAADLVSVLARARAGNRPGRHTLGLDRAQREDSWRDDGGEA
jgi:hypothetical protein